jgi:hypothetical protein
MELGVSSAAESMTSQVWISISRTTMINPWKPIDDISVARQMRDENSDNGKPG